MARSIAPADLVALVDALADAEWHSGETLAEQFGLTRAGLAKRLTHLRDWGLSFDTQQGRGYRLSHRIERLDEEQLRRSVPPALQVSVVPSVDSTNRAVAEASASLDPQAVLAEHQSAGRGRRGRAWQSPFGANLYLSMSWRWNLWPAQLPALSLAIGVVCARALQQQGLRGIQLKWPNDLWVDGRKVGGILIEQTGEVGGACRIVVGVGINVAMHEAQGIGIDQPWSSVNAALAEQGQSTTSRNALAIELLKGLHACLDGYASEGLAPWHDAWSRLDALAGKAIHALDDPDCRGIGAGIDEEGAYRIQTANGVKRVHAGDVSLRTD